MENSPFDELKGLRLTIVRRVVDMLVAHFGPIRPHRSGEGTIGSWALHVQCPWRFEGPMGTITGSSDLWAYAKGEPRPDGWSYEDGGSLQDKKLSELFGPRDDETRSWYNRADRLEVTKAVCKQNGDLTVSLSGSFALVVFPAGCDGEAWRFFEPGHLGPHLIFPVK